MSQVTQREYSLAICRKWKTMTEENDLSGNYVRHHFDKEGGLLGFTVNYRDFYLMKEL